jgi:transcriptional regulator with XRE-family HTH domain
MPENLQTLFGRILRRRRDEAGLSQEKVGQDSGLSRNYVGMLERGERVPTIITVQQLAKALKTSMVELIGELERDAAAAPEKKPRGRSPAKK